MYQGQKLKNKDGVEVALFPIDCIYITQGEYGSISHTLAMDFVGWTNEQGQIYHYPYFAPVDMKCVAYNSNQAWYIWESINPVLYADGTIDYLTLCVMHDDSPPYGVGQVVSQGDLLGRSGSSGYATGDHIHFNVARGKYQGWTTGMQFNELLNSIHIYDAFFVNDTTRFVDYGYNWQEFQEEIEPPTPAPEPQYTLNKKKTYKFFYNKHIKIDRKRG